MGVDKDLSNIMLIVDKNKLKMSDGDYIDICGSIKQVHLKLKGENIIKNIIDVRLPLNKCLAFLITGQGILHILRAIKH